MESPEQQSITKRIITAVGFVYFMTMFVPSVHAHTAHTRHHADLSSSKKRPSSDITEAHVPEVATRGGGLHPRDNKITVQRYSLQPGDFFPKTGTFINISEYSQDDHCCGRCTIPLVAIPTSVNNMPERKQIVIGYSTRHIFPKIINIAFSVSYLDLLATSPLHSILRYRILLI